MQNVDLLVDSYSQGQRAREERHPAPARLWHLSREQGLEKHPVSKKRNKI